MSRYLEPAKIAQLLSAEKPSPELFTKLGLNEERARKLREQWVAKIHGRCQTCGAEQCDCKSVSTGDNRKVEKVLKQLPMTTVLSTVKCRSCFNQSPFTVRNALWRLSKENDWEAFFKCKPCYESMKAMASLKNKLSESTEAMASLKNELRLRRESAKAETPKKQPLKKLAKQQKTLSPGDTRRNITKKTTKKTEPKRASKKVAKTVTKEASKSRAVPKAAPRKTRKKIALKVVQVPQPQPVTPQKIPTGDLKHRPFVGLKFAEAE
jgi:hypothetical protein